MSSTPLYDAQQCVPWAPSTSGPRPGLAQLWLLPDGHVHGTPALAGRENHLISTVSHDGLAHWLVGRSISFWTDTILATPEWPCLWHGGPGW